MSNGLNNICKLFIIGGISYVYNISMLAKVQILVKPRICRYILGFNTDIHTFTEICIKATQNFR